MATGDYIKFEDGYWFRETFHGPLMPDNCTDCGAEIYSVQPTGRINEWGLEEDCGATAQARCSTCGRAHYGLPAY